MVGPGGGGAREDEEGGGREARGERERGEERGDGGERGRLGEELPADLRSERLTVVLGGDPRHGDPRRDREQERRELRDEPVADREERVAPRRRREVHPAERARHEPSGDVHDDHRDARDGVSLHELQRSVHRPVQLALALERAPAAARLRRVDRARADVRVDRHLLPGERVEREAGGDLGDALGALRDDEQLHEREDREHDHADDRVSLDDDAPERLDDPARLAARQHEPRRGDVERHPEQGREQEEGREAREAERAPGEEGHDEDGGGSRDVEREERVQDAGGERRDEEEDDREHREREHRLAGAAEAREQRVEGGHGPPAGS